MPVKWYGPQVMVKVNQVMATRVMAAAISLRDYLKAQMSEIHPTVWKRRRKKRATEAGKIENVVKRVRRRGLTGSGRKGKRNTYRWRNV